MRRKARRPTNAELEILQVLWRRGPSSVRDVHRELQASREVGYTTVLKHMQIMREKGLISADTSVRPQIFEPARTRLHTQKQLVRDLLDRAFGGAPGRLVLQALSEKRATSEERKRIRELLDRLEGDEE